MRFSIIIPAYNTERYIDDCLYSVLQQDFPQNNFEVIVVDDCSPDHLVDKVKALQSHYPNLVYVKHQVNTRQGGGRNTGMRMAKGEYILFLDSDDYFLYENVLSTLNRYLAAHNSTILRSVKGGVSVSNDSHYKAQNYHGDPIFTKSSFKEFRLTERFALHVWATCYKRDFLLSHACWFRENVLFEDLDWIIKVTFQAGEIDFIDFNYYGYRVSTVGVTRVKSEAYFMGNVEAVRAIKEFYDNVQIEDPLLRDTILNGLPKDSLNLLMVSRDFPISTSVRCMKQAIRYHLFNSSRYRLTVLQRMQFGLCRHFPVIPVAVVRMMVLTKRMILSLRR